jgi:HD superfamily phosphohydrolase
MSLTSDVEGFVEKRLSEVALRHIRDKKLIRDVVQGAYTYFEHEVNIIDLPIVQRLRRINQTGLAFLAYPSATHNRFQHSLGVMVVADKFAISVKAKYPKMISDDAIREIRLAGLLHDVGHGIFSHPSEEILNTIPQVKSELLKNKKFSKAKPHEMLSYKIVSSKAFKDLFDEVKRKYQIDMDVANVANMIVGDMETPHTDGYKADIINGPFDADKLDYISRDAYFTGLKMDVDLDRIMHTTLIDFRLDEPRRLIADVSGAHNLEQVLFNKILLYTSVYHHHKVRAGACMLKSIFEIIWDNDLEVNGLSFKRAVDFLSVDDHDIFTSFEKIPELSSIVKNIKLHNILKRALVMSRRNVKEGESKYNFHKLIKLFENPDKVRELRELIVEEMGKVCSVYELWVDLPESPSLREPSQCIIKSSDDYIPLEKIFPADWWLVACEETKWKAYIFSPPDVQIRKKAQEATLTVLKECYDIEFKPAARSEAKIY